MTDTQIAKNKRKFVTRLKEARIGDVSAQYDVALMYANGVGTAKNVVQAFTWARTAAEKGNHAAQYLLGSALFSGLGTSKDEMKAMSWFLKAQESGSDKAAFKLARLLETAQPELAFEFAHDAATKGLAEAQYFVAECLALGSGVVANSEQALSWMQKAADQGLAAAQYGVAKATDDQALNAKPAAAVRHLLRKAAKAGHPGAQLALDEMELAGRSRSLARDAGNLEVRLKDYAKSGQAEDFFHLGKLYELGHSLERNLKQARAWYKKAAEAGHLGAQFALANSFERSESSQAVEWLQKAAAQGHTQAQLVLGQRLQHGVGLEPDPLGAVGMYLQAALGGNLSAQEEVWHMLTDQSEALHHASIVRAAQSGSASAQFALGERCFLGQGADRNLDEAFRWYRMAADQGHAQAQCALAGCFLEGLGVPQDLVQAITWFEKAAMQNVPQAQWKLGEWYATGLPNNPPDSKKATTLCTLAANAGFAPAQATLAALFAKADMPDRAAHWWMQAAEQGDLEAQFNIAYYLRSGIGLKKDPKQAFDWLLKAAQGGLASAQSRLALAYVTGDGAALDPIEGAKWFELAARAGDASAATNSKRAKGMLSLAQQAEVDRRVQEWKPVTPNKV